MSQELINKCLYLICPQDKTRKIGREKVFNYKYESSKGSIVATDKT